MMPGTVDILNKKVMLAQGQVWEEVGGGGQVQWCSCTAF